MHAFFYKYILTFSVVVFVISVFVFSTQVFAIGKPSGVGGAVQGNPGYNAQSNSSSGYVPSQGTQPTGSSQGGVQSSGIPTQGQSHIPAFAQVHLQDAKLRACQAVSTSVITRSTHLVDLVTQMEKTFTSIADGVEQYYLTKVVPTGKTLPNYDALVADISTKQNSLAPLVQTAQTDASSFSCTGNNPAAQLTQYRTDMQGVLKGLQDYRTAVKNLIVAVRTLPSVNPSKVPSATPTTTVTPSVTP